MIDEKKLVEDLNNKNTEIVFELPVEEVLGENVDLDDFAMLVQDAVRCYRKMILDLIHKQPKAGVWILCSERMPEKATEVIACDADGVIVMGYLHKYRNGVACKSAPFITHNIVAWMPLPEPYKSGN